MTGYIARDTWSSMTRVSLSPAELSERILQILADGEPRTPREIHGPHGLMSAATRSALLELVRAGTIIRDGMPGQFRYRLATCDGVRVTLAPAMEPETQQEPA